WAGSPVSAEEDTVKPFIVKVHADWCGTCTQLEPTFEALDAKYRDSARLVVFDVTDRQSLEKSRAEADRLGLRAFFEANKFKTGIIAVIDGRTRETVAIFGGETDARAYDAAIASALGDA
ncbi:MAG: TlpA family protein disulfide reductase, partial [Myxococcota bacterium]